jgi:hypothetical protein
LSLGNRKANLKTLAVKFKVTPRSSQVETPQRHLLTLEAVIYFLHHKNPSSRSRVTPGEKNGQEQRKKTTNPTFQLYGEQQRERVEA